MIDTVLFDMGGTLEDIWVDDESRHSSIQGVLDILRAHGIGNVNSKCEKNIKKYNQASRANSSRHSANTISEVFQPNISRG